MVWTAVANSGAAYSHFLVLYVRVSILKTMPSEHFLMLDSISDPFPQNVSSDSAIENTDLARKMVLEVKALSEQT